MSSETDETVIMNILRASFPEADDIQFTRNASIERDQHYTSDITNLSMKYKRNHKNHQIDLTIKIPKERQQSAFYEKLDFFIREALVYAEMLPLVHQSLDYLLAPLHYHTIDQRILVLEDLSKQGYQSRDKCDSLNSEQCYPILRTLSHFHAVTYKLRQMHPRLLSELPFQRSAVAELRRNYASSWESPLCDLLEKKDASHLIPKFLGAVSFLRQDDDVILPIISESNFDFVVLNHGDFKIGNLLFKYSSPDTVESVKMIDFQICLWTSPAADFIFFLTTSVHIDTVQEHFHTLVDWYLRCLNEKLRQLDCARTYTKEQFMEDFNKLKFFTLIMVMLLCSIMSPLDKRQREAVFMLDEKEKTCSGHISLKDVRFQHVSYGWLKFCEKMGILDVDQLENQ